MADLLIENFNVLQQLFTDCLIAKNNPKISNIKLQETRRKATLLFVLLKKVNRSLQYRVQHAKDNLMAEKRLMDNKRLILQNLLYEQSQLEQQIWLCYQFKGQVKNNDDIYESQKLTNDDDHEIELTHKQSFQYLELELNERMKLANEYNKLVNAKMKLREDIRHLTQLLTFPSLLKAAFQAIKPLQDDLQLPLKMISSCEFENTRQLLPSSLYLAYINLKCIQLDVNHFKVKVIDNADEIKVYNNLKDQLNFMDMNNKQCLWPHPLHLQITINIPKFANDTLTIDIFNIPLLDLVTAHYNVHVMNTLETNFENIIMKDFLKFICQNDYGDCIPYGEGENESKLQKCYLYEADCLKYLMQNNWGKPYGWLQQLCGGASKTFNAKCDRLKAFTTDIIKRLKQYWQIRLHLLDQIKAFVEQNLEKYMDDNERKCKPKCSLVQWSFITWEEYVLNPNTLCYREAQLVDEDCNVFRAVFVFNSAKMDCLISISNKYIYNTPIWIMTVYWNGQYYNALNNALVKIMEYSTNSNCNKSSHMLASQLLHTMYSFDKFLNADNHLLESDNTYQ